MKNSKNILIGVIFILLGVVVGLKALDIVDINIFFEGWWTLFIIVPCFVGLFDSTDRTGNLIGLVIGVVLLLSVRDIISFNLVWKLILPIILIIVGTSLIFKNTLINKVRTKVTAEHSNSICATFSSQNVDFDKEKFTGAELNAIFGGVKLDLRNAVIKEDVIIDATSIFGGITIFVPSNVKVKITSSSIFGGVDNKSLKTETKNAATVYVNASCLFGGVEVK